MRGMVPLLTWLSDRTEVRGSAIEGRGLFARVKLEAGETVAVKGGYVFTREMRDGLPAVMRDSEIQIAGDLFLGPVTPQEREAAMMFLNHSCAPNVGVRGRIAFCAMRDIAAGEELTLDYAMFDDDEYRMNCTCGQQQCRGVITGRDWRIPALQARYAGWFSTWLEEKIRQRKD